MKFYILNAVLIFLNAYVVLRFTKHLHLLKHQFFIISSIVALVLFQKIGLDHDDKFINVIGRFFDSDSISSQVYQASYFLFGIITCLFFYTAIMDIASIAIKLICIPSSPISIYFNKFYVPAIILVTSLTVILGLITIIKGPVVEKVEVVIKNLPGGFDNFRIVQISDLHVGKIIKRDYVLNVVEIANSLSPNLIALTGDFVDGSVRELKNDVEPLRQLKSTHGTFFVTGNHEYYSGAEQWKNEFRNLGFNVLSNGHVIINNYKDHIIIAGVTDYSTIRLQSQNASNPSQVIMGAQSELVKILLAHQPVNYIEAHKAGYDLQLSGHTHAGQYFPFTLLIIFFHKYFKGLNNHDGMWIYISRGTGYWGPPLRLGAPPEITLITLKKGLK